MVLGFLDDKHYTKFADKHTGYADKHTGFADKHTGFAIKFIIIYSTNNYLTKNEKIFLYY